MNVKWKDLFKPKDTAGKKKVNFSKAKLAVIASILSFIFIFPKALDQSWFLTILDWLPDIAGALVLLMLLYVWVILIAVFITIIVDKISEKAHLNLNKRMSNTTDNLYIWLGTSEISDNYMIRLFEDAKTNENEFENLLKMKEILRAAFKDSKENYMIFKNYLEFRLKNNTYNIVNGYFISIIFGAISTIFLPQIIGSFMKGARDENELYNYFVSVIYGPQLVSFYIALIFGIGLYLVVIGLINNFSIRKRRIEFIISTLDIMIQNKGD